MDWNDYRNKIDQANLDSEISQRAAKCALAVWQTRKEKHSMKNRTLRMGLIAACVASVLCICAAAAAITWNQKIRQDLGIVERPIAEYTEYENAEQAGMTLLSSVCSGQQMEAFFTLKNVPKNQEIELKTLEFLGVDAKTPVTSLVTVSDYDAKNNTVLVRVTILGQALEQAKAVSIGLSWSEEPSKDLFAEIKNLPKDENGAPIGLEEYVENINANVLPQYEHSFGPVEVPVTESEILTASGNAQLSSGIVTSVRVGAGFIEFVIDGSEITEADPDKAHSITTTIQEAIAADLANAAVRFADGTEMNIAQMQSPWAAAWVYSDGEPASGKVQHILSQMLNLQQVTAIVLNGEAFALNKD